MKKTLALFLTLLLLAAAFPMQPATAERAGDWEYSIDSTTNEARITHYLGSDTSVVIPRALDGYQVTAIAAEAFVGKLIESVEIGNNVMTVEERAFSSCPFLTSFTVAADNPNYKADDDGVLLTKDGKTLLQYPAGKEQTSYTIPYGVETIAADAFSPCKALSNIVIPDTVTRIGTDAFYGTAWYKAQGDGVVYAGNIAYTWKGTMPANTAVAIRQGTKIISDGAFRSQTNLTSVTIPDSVEHMGEEAFYRCSALLRISFGAKVDHVGRNALSETAWYNAQPDGLIYVGNAAYAWKGNMPNGTTQVLKNGTKSITAYAFSECTSLTEIVIPDSVVAIGERAFTRCSSLRSVEISDSVVTIGRGTFSYCSSLSSIAIPNGVEAIKEYAFSWCTSLTSVYFEGEPPKEFYHSAFSRCGDVTLYYYSLYKNLWAPNGETTWNRYNIAELPTPFFVIDMGSGRFERQYPIVNAANRTILNVPPNTTRAELLAVLGASGGSSTYLKTGDTLTLNGIVYTVIVMGDVNCNGNVEADDASTLLRAIVRLITLNEYQALAANTYMSDGYTASDASAILRFIVKLEPTIGVVE
ncbi:MAG: leucine-rich repeat protein [Clostridia bacterium]|nr:leucine-rich repeat protein [Clostridia bacterium]